MNLQGGKIQPSEEGTAVFRVLAFAVQSGSTIHVIFL